MDQENMAKYLLVLGTASTLGLVLVFLTQEPEHLQSRLLFFCLLFLSLISIFALIAHYLNLRFPHNPATTRPLAQSSVLAAVIVIAAVLKTMQALGTVNVLLLVGLFVVGELTLLSRR